LLSFGVTFAEVTLGGSVNQVYTTTNDHKLLSKTNRDKSTNSTTTSIGSSSGATGDSFLTFSGSEDLGDGIKASFKIEPRLGINEKEGKTNLFGGNREAWLGLSGAFGSINIGNNYTPLALYVVFPFDPNGTSNAGGYLVSNNATFNAGNSISYTAPAFVEGLSLQVNINEAGGTTNAGDSTGWGLRYNAGPISAGLAGETTKNSQVTPIGLDPLGSTTKDVEKIGYALGYDFGAAKITLNGINTKQDSLKLETIGYGIAVPFGAITLKASMSNGSIKADGAKKVKMEGYQLGANYALSKRTSAYFLLGNLKVTTADDTKSTQTSVGVVHNF
jgi:predicted porin